MTEDQVNEAIEQMRIHTRNSVEAFKAGNGAYETMSARSVLRTLGYGSDDILQVLKAIAARGFDYCLDAEIPMTGHHEASGELPDWKVCYWGADQLLSRLQCLR